VSTPSLILGWHSKPTSGVSFAGSCGGMKCGTVSPSIKLANFYSPSGTRQKFRTTRERFRLTKRNFKCCDAATQLLSRPRPFFANLSVMIALGCAERLGELRPARPRMYRSGGRGHHAAQLTYPPQAAARSSLSAPRATILSASSGRGLCSAFAPMAHAAIRAALPRSSGSPASP
jgi:hypothetical protein